MIIHLYGKDSYRRNKNTNTLLRAYKKKHEFIDVFSFDLEERGITWKNVKDFLNQPSMFVDSKVAVVREGGAVAKEDEKEWAKFLKKHLTTPKTFVLISNESKPKKLYDFLLKLPVQSQEFSELEGQKLELFLKKEMADRELSFLPDAWNFFIRFIEASEEKSWRAVNELQKLRFVQSKNPTSLQELKKVIQWQEKEAPYLAARQILGSLGAYQKLGMLERLLLQKHAPAYIFNSLGFQARGEKAILLADYDVSVKSGGLEYEEALTDFVLKC